MLHTRTVMFMLLSVVTGFASPAQSQLQSSGYILGPDDTVELSVYGQPDLSERTRIKSDGTINLPILGPVHAGGLTVAQLIATVTRQYEEGHYLVKPSINIEVTDYVSRAATVLGNVQNPGNYALDRDYTIPALIARAGGVRADGANAVYLTHKGASNSAHIELADQSGGALAVVQPGDTLFVPTAELVYVYGQVNQPGAFPFHPGTTFRQALAKAGGPTLAGTTKRIEVRRDGHLVKDLSLDDQARPEDVLIIKEKLF